MIPRGRSGTEVDMWRQRILDVAEQHFRHIGFQKTTVADIAKCLKMSSANVYRFPLQDGDKCLNISYFQTADIRKASPAAPPAMSLVS
ncbi:TetR/AcrR family transcriptional regulator [Rhizobium johnstonii]|uniref:TetR/AcrR family transcriptional regulator n=1 Tax=Rhizobium johnstonii TaxID=3019933 RepID=UPI003F950D65